MQPFACCFDLRSIILPSVLNFTSRNSEAEVVIKVLSQETNGDILFSFYDAEAPRSASLGTHIGVYSPSQGQFKHLYEAGKGGAEIVSCSLTSCHSLLGFTKFIPNTGRSEAGLPKGKHELYFVNMGGTDSSEKKFISNREAFASAQFLPCSDDCHRHQALIFNHTEGIGIYEFTGPFATPHNARQLVRRHLWYQWDGQTQTLFVLHPVKLFVRPRAQQLYIKCQQIMADAKHHDVFDIPVDVRVSVRASSKLSYTRDQLQGTAPVKGINLRVLSQPSGLVSFCWQVFPEDSIVAGAVKADVKATAPETTTHCLEYCVHSVIHRKVIKVKVPHHNSSRGSERRVCFIQHKDYVLAYLPGCFVHLIDVSSHSDATHHVINQSPVMHSSLGVSGNLSEYRSMTSGSNYEGTGIYDPFEQRAYAVDLSVDYLLEVFKQSYSPYTRLALVRYLTVHHNDQENTIKLLLMIKEDTGSPEVYKILMEYIMSTSHTAMLQSRLQNASISKFLPYSGNEDYVKSGAGRLALYIVKARSGDGGPVRVEQYYSSDPTTHMAQGLSRAGRGLTEEPNERGLANRWHYLAACCRSRPLPQQRLTTKDGFLDVTTLMALIGNRRKSSVVDSPESPLPAHVVVNHDDLSHESPAEVYVDIMYDTIKGLYELLWEVVPFEEEELFLPSDESFCCSKSSYNLDFISAFSQIKPARRTFQMLEQFYYALVNLGVAPPKDFTTVFGMLAYRVLPRRLFLQYVEKRIVAITTPLMRLLVAEQSFARTACQNAFFLQCISKLPLEDAIAASWTVKHASAMQFAAEEAVAYCYEGTQRATDEIVPASKEPPIANLRNDDGDAETRGGCDLLTRMSALSSLMSKLSASGVCTLADERNFEDAAFYFTKRHRGGSYVAARSKE